MIHIHKVKRDEGYDMTLSLLHARSTADGFVASPPRHTFETPVGYPGPHGKIPGIFDPVTERFSHGGNTGCIPWMGQMNC
ncbi:MAG: hypothetical protein WBS20_14590 [Lysobacterales bacterium]